MRYREDHVEIGNWKQIFSSFSQPLLTGVGLALWAMAISAGVVRNGLMATSRASVQMAAEGLRATVANSSQHFQLRPRQMGLVPVNEVVARRPNDIGHLEGWPVHFLTRFRERLTSSGLDSSTAPIGLLTACR